MSNVRHTRARSAGFPAASNAAAADVVNANPLSSRPKPKASQSSAGNVSSVARSGGGGCSSVSGCFSLDLFLRNVKLLDLDLCRDWPGMTEETFAATHGGSGAGGARRGTSAQGQKKRVQCVEWALFRLFEIWDPEETRNKLKPFFPPLDQIQSTNLRAALLRALEQAKKNGYIGRDVVIRKLMLDECKGERLEELLAAFSSAVLRKVSNATRDENGFRSTPALQLALGSAAGSGKGEELEALSLAYRFSLRGLLNRKKATAARYHDFANLLRVKELSIARAKEELAVAEGKDAGGTLPEGAIMETIRLVRNNWAGDERWMEVLLYGGARNWGQGLFDSPFDLVWHRVEQGRLGELEESNGDLLEQLEFLATTQAYRLHKLRELRQELSVDQPLQSPSKAELAREMRGIDLGFTCHETLQTGTANSGAVKQRQHANEEYTALIGGLRMELKEPSTGYGSSLAYLQKRKSRRIGGALAATHEEALDNGEVSELIDSESERGQMSLSSSTNPVQTTLETVKRQPVRPMLPHPKDSGGMARNTPGVTDETELPSLEPSQRGQPIVDGSFHPLAGTGSSSSHSRRQSPIRDACTMLPPPRPVQKAVQHKNSGSLKQDLADLLLQTMDSSSPPPPRRARQQHTLSLADRTRLSMARRSSPFLDDEEPDVPATTANHTSYAGPEVVLAHERVVEDLASRTRRSMAGFDKARQAAQLERRRSLRKSRLAPRRETDRFGEVLEQDEPRDYYVLAEDLMAEQDVEAVFRARPKVRASPLPSLTREQNEDGQDY